MNPSERICKGCNGRLSVGRPDRLYCDNKCRKRWQRLQPVKKEQEAAKRTGQPEEYAEAVAFMENACADLALIFPDVREAKSDLLYFLAKLRDRNPERRALAERDGLRVVGGMISNLRTLILSVADDLEQAENTLINGQLGGEEVGEALLLAVIAVVPGLELSSNELAIDDEDDESEY